MSGGLQYLDLVVELVKLLGELVVLLGIAEQIATLGGNAPPLHLVGVAAELGLGQAALSAGLGVVTTLQGLLPLGLEGAMVDPGVAAGGGEGRVEMRRPSLAPGVQGGLAVPGTLLGGGEARRHGGVDLPGGGHQHGGALPPAITGDGLADSEIDDHAAGDELFMGEAADELDLLPVVELARQAEGDLAGELGILALLGGLDGVPQALAILHPGGGMAGG